MTKKNNNKKQELKLVIFSFDSPQPTGPRNHSLPPGPEGLGLSWGIPREGQRPTLLTQVRIYKNTLHNRKVK